MLYAFRQNPAYSETKNPQSGIFVLTQDVILYILLVEEPLLDIRTGHISGTTFKVEIRLDNVY